MRDLMCLTWFPLALWLLCACGGDDNATSDLEGNPALADTDGDGFTDMQEQIVGRDIDTDGDGIADWQDPDSHPMVLDDGSCPSGNANASTGEARVILLLDGSTSMEDPLGGGGGGGGQSRWEAMRSALMDDDGVVPRLQSVVEFGMAVYSGSLGGFGDGGPAGCPEVSVTAPSYDNFPALDGALPNRQPGGSTPTHLALQQILDPQSGLFQDDQPDQRAPTQVLVIATDGQPNNLCQGGMQIQDPQAAADVVSAVSMAQARGIRTYVVSLAGGDGGLMTHLEEVAQAGGTGEAPFVPQSRDELIGTLQAIVGGAIGCRILLDGMVAPGLECMGTVTMNNRELTCGTDYEVVGGRDIELLGSVCDEFMDNPVSLVHAQFPCGAFTPDNPI